MSPNITLICSNCGEEVNIQKVSVIVDGGITRTSYESAAPITWKGETYHLPISKEATSSTALAKKLAAPEVPEVPRKANNAVSCLSVISVPIGLGIVVSLFPLVSIVSNITGIIGVICLIISILVWLFSVYMSYKFRISLDRKNKIKAELEFQQKMNHYNSEIQAISKWQKLYYCHKCGSVFIPGESRSVPIDRMNETIHA